MRIAMLGTRGIPASYSGFETCVEQLSQRLVERGHEVTVYCRSHHIDYPEDTYKGINLVKLPTIRNKYLDTIAHSFISSIHLLTSAHYDIALYFIAGNSPVSWIPRIVGTRTILNVDGLDWKRQKWPILAKHYIKFAEYLATKLPNLYITDSKVVQEYYRNKFGTEPPYIAYGSDVECLPPGETLQKIDLQPHRYVLFVGRLVPENCPDHLVEAFKQIDTDTYKCVIVGDAPYADDYIRSLKQLGADDDRIVFTGYVFGEGYQELGSNASIFVETSGVGGTHPALVEAMAFGNCCIVHDTEENLETIGDAGLAYNGSAGSASLRELLEDLLKDPEKIQKLGKKAQQRALDNYSWDAITSDYESLFESVLK